MGQVEFDRLLVDAVSSVQQQLEKQAEMLQAASAQRETELSQAWSEIKEQREKLAARSAALEQEWVARRAELESEYEQKFTALEEEKLAFDEEKARMAIDTGYGDVIPLNLGGELMVDVKRGTLCQCKDSALASMFSGRWDSCIGRDMNGRVLLDFSPALLSPLIEYLRAKRIEVPGHPVRPPDVPQLLQEDFCRMLNYFGLEEYVANDVSEVTWYWKASESCNDKRFSENGLELCGLDSAAVFGSTVFSNGTHSWAVEVRSMCNGELCCAIGLGTSRTPAQHPYPYNGMAVAYQCGLGRVDGAALSSGLAKAKSGDVIGCRLCFPMASLSFYLNGALLCVLSLAGLGDGPFIPIVSAWGDYKTTVTLISTSNVR